MKRDSFYTEINRETEIVTVVDRYTESDSDRETKKE